MKSFTVLVVAVFSLAVARPSIIDSASNEDASLSPIHHEILEQTSTGHSIDSDSIVLATSIKPIDPVLLVETSTSLIERLHKRHFPSIGNTDPSLNSANSANGVVAAGQGVPVSGAYSSSVGVGGVPALP